MNQQNMSKTPCSTTQDLPIKRKRGRPRKDESMSRKEKRQTTTTSISPSQPPPMSTMTTIQPPPTVTNISDNHNMVGQVVTGVIDGVFDAGYLISVGVGPNNSLLRGLVFQQGHYCPVTRANDVAPHLKICRRENFQIPITNQTQLCTSKAACANQPSPQQIAIPVTMQNYQTSPIIAGGSSNSAPPPETLRMVEQDEFMQVFEVAKIVDQEQTKNHDFGHGFKNDHLISTSDIMAESLPQNNDHQSSVKEFEKIEQHEEENPEPVTQLELGVEEPSPLRKDMLQEEQKTEGEMSKIDVNQDPNQGVSTDLFQTNYDKQLFE